MIWDNPVTFHNRNRELKAGTFVWATMQWMDKPTVYVYGGVIGLDDDNWIDDKHWLDDHQWFEPITWASSEPEAKRAITGELVRRGYEAISPWEGHPDRNFKGRTAWTRPFGNRRLAKLSRVTLKPPPGAIRGYKAFESWVDGMLDPEPGDAPTPKEELMTKPSSPSEWDWRAAMGFRPGVDEEPPPEFREVLKHLDEAIWELPACDEGDPDLRYTKLPWRWSPAPRGSKKVTFGKLDEIFAGPASDRSDALMGIGFDAEDAESIVVAIDRGKPLVARVRDRTMALHSRRMSLVCGLPWGQPREKNGVWSYGSQNRICMLDPDHDGDHHSDSTERTCGAELQ